MPTNILGINVAAVVVPYTTDDQFATHDAQYGKGGHREVQSIAERNAITTQRRTQGMTCYIRDTDETYRLKTGITNADWVLLTNGGGNAVYESISGNGEYVFATGNPTKTINITSADWQKTFVVGDQYVVNLLLDSTSDFTGGDPSIGAREFKLRFVYDGGTTSSGSLAVRPYSRGPAVINAPAGAPIRGSVDSDSDANEGFENPSAITQIKLYDTGESVELMFNPDTTAWQIVNWTRNPLPLTADYYFPGFNPELFSPPSLPLTQANPFYDNNVCVPVGYMGSTVSEGETAVFDCYGRNTLTHAQQDKFSGRFIYLPSSPNPDPTFGDWWKIDDFNSLVQRNKEIIVKKGPDILSTWSDGTNTTTDILGGALATNIGFWQAFPISADDGTHPNWQRLGSRYKRKVVKSNMDTSTGGASELYADGPYVDYPFTIFNPFTAPSPGMDPDTQTTIGDVNLMKATVNGGYYLMTFERTSPSINSYNPDGVNSTFPLGETAFAPYFHAGSFFAWWLNYANMTNAFLGFINRKGSTISTFNAADMSQVVFGIKFTGLNYDIYSHGAVITSGSISPSVFASGGANLNVSLSPGTVMVSHGFSTLLTIFTYTDTTFKQSDMVAFDDNSSPGTTSTNPINRMGFLYSADVGDTVNINFYPEIWCFKLPSPIRGKLKARRTPLADPYHAGSYGAPIRGGAVTTVNKFEYTNYDDVWDPGQVSAQFADGAQNRAGVVMHDRAHKSGKFTYFPNPRFDREISARSVTAGKVYGYKVANRHIIADQQWATTNTAESTTNNTAPLALALTAPSALTTFDIVHITHWPSGTFTQTTIGTVTFANGSKRGVVAIDDSKKQYWSVVTHSLIPMGVDGTTEFFRERNVHGFQLREGDFIGITTATTNGIDDVYVTFPGWDRHNKYF